MQWEAVIFGAECTQTIKNIAEYMAQPTIAALTLDMQQFFWWIKTGSYSNASRINFHTLITTGYRSMK